MFTIPLRDSVAGVLASGSYLFGLFVFALLATLLSSPRRSDLAPKSPIRIQVVFIIIGIVGGSVLLIMELGRFLMGIFGSSTIPALLFIPFLIAVLLTQLKASPTDASVPQGAARAQRMLRIVGAIWGSALFVWVSYIVMESGWPNRITILSSAFLLIILAVLGFLTLITSPASFFWSRREFSRVYYPSLLGGSLILLLVQLTATILAPAATRRVDCFSYTSVTPELPLALQIGDTLELSSGWSLYSVTDPSDLLAPRPRPLLPLWAPKRLQAVKVGTTQIRIIKEELARAPEVTCDIPIVIR